MKPNLSKYFWGMGKRGDGNQSTLIIKKKIKNIYCRKNKLQLDG